MSGAVHIDYEARSGVDITEVGSPRWSCDPRFEILMAAVSRDDEDCVLLWINPLFGGSPENAEAEQILREATVLYAHNAPNEVANTWGAFLLGLDCPFVTEPPLEKWRCTAAMARKAGLPYSLEKCCEALNLQVKKDPRGKKLIKLFCMPDEETNTFRRPQDHPAEWAEFCAYCRNDVVAEKGIHKALKPFELTGAALATFQFDLRMNQRGIPINVTAARNAQKIIDHVQSGVVAEFRALTGLNPTQRAKFQEWLKDHCWIDVPNLQGPTVETTLDEFATCIAEGGQLGERRCRAFKGLGMYQKVSYAAVKKVQTMLNCVCPDGRVRGAHMYYGAGTGRWSGKLLQPQNFKKTPKWMREITAEVYQAISDGASAYALDEVFGDPLELIAGCIRHFIHLPGTEVLDGDYSAVEARTIAWLAGQDDVLEQWRQYDLGKGPGPYKIMAGYIYGVDPKAVTEDQREVGKRVVLGAGFQMGAKEFKKTCWTQYQLDLPIELCELGIKTFRTKSPKIRSYWYILNDAAKSCVKAATPSGPFRVQKIAGIPFLLFKLRSGRSLAYPHPRIELEAWTPDKIKDEYGEEVAQEVQYREQVTYWGQIPGSQQWGRIKLYGGKLAENETQATAADFMSPGAITAEARGMAPFMLVHDQGLALRNKGQTADEYAAALATLPNWARGFPMKVEAKIAPYYKK